MPRRILARSALAPRKTAPAHLTTELMKLLTKTDMIHVPYKGAAPAMTDLMGGQIPLFLDPPPNLIQPAKAGRIRLIGVASDRLAVLPDVPTFAEQGIPDLMGSTWAAHDCPGRSAREIVQRMSAEVIIIRSPEISPSACSRPWARLPKLDPEEGMRSFHCR